jgi:hypothetical protein
MEGWFIIFPQSFFRKEIQASCREKQTEEYSDP